MTVSDLKKAVSLGVIFTVQIVGHPGEHWSMCLKIKGDKTDPGTWIELANNRGMKRYSTVDKCLLELKDCGFNFSNGACFYRDVTVIF